MFNKKYDDLSHHIDILEKKVESLDSINQSYMDLFDKVMYYNNEVMAKVGAIRDDLVALDNRMQELEIFEDQVNETHFDIGQRLNDLESYINENKEDIKEFIEYLHSDTESPIF